MDALRQRPSRFATPALVAVVAVGWFVRTPIVVTIALLVLVGTTTAFLVNGRYALRRIAMLIPIMVVVSFVVFCLMAFLPGDPAINILGPSATPDAVAKVNEELGLDQPLFNRYGDWLGDVVMGDLGTSVQRREEVSDGVLHALTPSLQLMFYSVVLSLAMAMPLGVWAAYREGQTPDRIINTVMLGFFAVPPFVLAVVSVLFLSIGGIKMAGVDVGFSLLPASRYVPFGQDKTDHFKHLLLPAFSLSMGQAAVYMRLLRSDMIATLRLPFIDLARSKGLSDRRILWHHALRPSMFTVLTVMGFTVGTVVGGAMIIEAIFVLPGLGGYVIGSIAQRDFIAVQGAILVIATLYILTLTMLDFVYLAVDPRLRDHHG